MNTFLVTVRFTFNNELIFARVVNCDNSTNAINLVMGKAAYITGDITITVERAKE